LVRLIINVTRLAKKQYFTLVIKNKTKVITIPFAFIETGDNAILKGNFTINRLDFEVGDSSFILSDNVTVNIEAKVTRI
jgi:polyisoprenoid-binding protein YceI